jgi:hypothetical protein
LDYGAVAMTKAAADVLVRGAVAAKTSQAPAVVWADCVVAVVVVAAAKTSQAPAAVVWVDCVVAVATRVKAAADAPQRVERVVLVVDRLAHLLAGHALAQVAAVTQPTQVDLLHQMPVQRLAHQH